MNNERKEFARDLFAKIRAEYLGFISVNVDDDDDSLAVYIQYTPPTNGFFFKRQIKNLSSFIEMGATTDDILEMIKPKYETFFANKGKRKKRSKQLTKWSNHKMRRSDLSDFEGTTTPAYVPISDPAGYTTEEENEELYGTIEAVETEEVADVESDEV